MKWICGFANAQGGSIFESKLVIWNEGPIPREIKDLNAPHSSVPRNRLIADICFKAGYIDSWGRGIEKITTACTEHGCPAPNFEITLTGIRVTLLPKFNMPSQVSGQVDGQVSGQVDGWVLEVLRACESVPLKSREIQEIVGIKHRETFQRNYLDHLMEAGWLEMTVPDKPTSRLQKYRLTAKGQQLIEGLSSA